jgi:hypothetical protein
VDVGVATVEVDIYIVSGVAATLGVVMVARVTAATGVTTTTARMAVRRHPVRVILAGVNRRGRGRRRRRTLVAATRGATLSAYIVTGRRGRRRRRRRRGRRRGTIVALTFSTAPMITGAVVPAAVISMSGLIVAAPLVAVSPVAWVTSAVLTRAGVAALVVGCAIVVIVLRRLYISPCVFSVSSAVPVIFGVLSRWRALFFRPTLLPLLDFISSGGDRG